MVELQFQELLSHTSKYEQKLLDTLSTLVSFPSVAFRDVKTINECAEHLDGTFQGLGYKSKIYPTVPEGSPVVYAEKDLGASKTLMFYHHYDVQPEDPIESWDTPPWKMTIKDDRVYGRGVADDKGGLVGSIFGIQMLEDLLDELPVNIKFVVEGEEERGSVNLHKFTKPNQSLLKADGCIWEFAALIPESDTGFSIPTPVEFWCGLKGLSYFELIASGPPNFPRTDVHSGQAGGVANAAWRLVWALNTLKDQNENILIEGFNEMVVPPHGDDIEVLEAQGSDFEEVFKRDYHLDSLLLDRSGTDLLIPLFLAPTLSICGIKSGFQGLGVKTIVPASATVKVDFRITPNLTTAKVEELLRNHLDKNGFTDIKIKLITGYEPAKTPVNHPFVKTIREATKGIIAPMTVNTAPFAPGSGPAFHFTPHTPICAIRNPSEGHNVHAPNENLFIRRFKPTIAYNALIAQLVAEQDDVIKSFVD